MQQENKDSRCRLGSDNITADEVFTESELASMEFKYTVKTKQTDRRSRHAARIFLTTLRGRGKGALNAGGRTLPAAGFEPTAAGTHALRRLPLHHPGVPLDKNKVRAI